MIELTHLAGWIDTAYNLALHQPIPDEHLAGLFLQDPFPYLRFLYYVGKLFQVRLAVELGTCTGRGTAHLAAACQVVYTIDPELHGAFAENTRPYSNINFIRSRSDDLETLQQFEGHSLALCFIDSVHAYDYLMKEISLWSPKIAPGGLFLLDDLNLMPGALEAIPFENKGYLAGLHSQGFGYAFV